MAAFGLPMTLAESMTFDPAVQGTQSGAVVDTEFDPALSYRWTVENVDHGSIPTGYHLLLGLDDQGAPLTYYGEFEHRPGWVGNVGTLQLEPGSAFEDLIGPSVTGTANGDPIDVAMVVMRTDS